MKISIFLYRI